MTTSEANTAFSPKFLLRDLVSAHRAYQKLAEADKAAGAPIRIAVVSNYSTQFLTQALELALVERGFAPEIYEAGYNQFEIELTDPNSGLSGFKPDVVVLTLTSHLLSLRIGAGEERDFASGLAATINGAAERLAAKFVVTLPEPLQEEIDQTSWAPQWRNNLIAELERELDPSVCTVDFTSLIAEIGIGNWFSSRYYATSKLPFAPDHSAKVGDYLAHYVAGLVRRPVRLVITDLDDTLWGGTVGEVGWRGVDLDPEGTSYGFLRLQRYLAGLRAGGVLLAACSKNQPENALDVLRNRPEMILREDHFVSHRINWESKSENIASILEELNLTEPGCVFLDDNPLERAEIRHQFPEIWVPDLHQDPNERVAELAGSGRFVLPVATAEDLNRQDMYGTERKRVAAKSKAGSLADYYNSLGLVLTPARPDQGNWQRIVDLINKTNQFNVMTKRHSSQDLQNFVANPDNEVWAYSLADKYGEYGVISVLIAVREESSYLIDT